MSRLRARATSGDFPHARHRGVRLACCSCTTCCFTLLLGGTGGLIGSVLGWRRGLLILRAEKASDEPPITRIPGWLRILRRILLYGGWGILLGAGIGFLVDRFIVFR